MSSNFPIDSITSYQFIDHGDDAVAELSLLPESERPGEFRLFNGGQKGWVKGSEENRDGLNEGGRFIEQGMALPSTKNMSAIQREIFLETFDEDRLAAGKGIGRTCVAV